VGKYAFSGLRKVLLGRGTSSNCYLGVDIETGQHVAIKAYRPSIQRTGHRVARFKRQVDVLLELQRPFEQPADGALWSQELAGVDPSDLFLKLLDYSRDKNGRPGPDPVDGSMYIVTELADSTLRDHLKSTRGKAAGLPMDHVRGIAKEILLAVAGLHAKGFVHIDLKPANVMLVNGRWKLIDMDGCVRIGATVSDATFSHAYCSPEFARFAKRCGHSCGHWGGRLVVSPSLDAWSVGMTVAELISPGPVLREVHMEMSARHGPVEGPARFLGWIGALRAAPLSGRMMALDPDLCALLVRLLEPDASHRWTLAEALGAPCFRPSGRPAVPDEDP
jgi:serine/threonine protein kinase